MNNKTTEEVAREIENIMATLLENEIDEKLPELSNQVLYSDKLLHKIKKILDQHWPDKEATSNHQLAVEISTGVSVQRNKIIGISFKDVSK
jgi:hypothetical protein